MNEINGLATSLSTYGLYTIIAVLCIAVVYLFRQVNDLHRQIQGILTEQSKTSAELTTRVVLALEQSTKAIERIDGYFLDGRKS